MLQEEGGFFTTPPKMQIPEGVEEGNFDTLGPNAELAEILSDDYALGLK